MKYLLRLLSLAAMLLTTACSDVGLFAANAPTHFDDVTVQHDIAFGPNQEQKLDIYIPPHSADQKLSVVVFFYGGRWETGSKEDYRFAGTALASQGFITIIPDYRKYPAVKFPIFVDDGARAVAWVADHIAAYGGDPSRLHLAGHSSGAHIGALIAADPDYLKAFGKNRNIIRSFVGLSGPYAFTPDEKDLKDMFGPPARYPQMQVPTFIDGHQPPMLLLYGGSDKLVGKINLDRVVAAIDRKGGCVATRIYPGIDHVWIVAALSWLGRSKAPVLADMADYLRRSEQPDFCVGQAQH